MSKNNDIFANANSETYLSISTPDNLNSLKQVMELDELFNSNNMAGGKRNVPNKPVKKVAKTTKTAKKSSKKDSKKPSKKTSKKASKKDSKKTSKKGSWKMAGGVRKPSKNATNKGSKKASKKGSKKMSGGAKKQSKKASKPTPRKGSQKATKKASKKGSRKMSGGKREMNPGMKAFRELLEHVVAKAGVKYPVGMKLAKIYNDEAKAKHPGKNAVEIAAEAKKLFDKDGDVQKKIKQIEQQMKEKKESK